MRKVYLLGIVILATLGAKAQFNQDWGFSLGAATHMGDIGGPQEKSYIQFSRVNYAIGAFYRYRLNNMLYVKPRLTYARISGDDKFSAVPAHIARNLSFRTDLYELAVTAEVHFIDIKDFGGTGRYNTFFNVYAFAGIGVTYFEPQAKADDGTWVKLQPLKTEGVVYSKITPVVPLGIGSHMTFDRKWRIGLEIGARMTFTDYLDDVHDRYLKDSDYESELQKDMANRSDQAYIDANAPGEWVEGYKMGDGGVRGGPDSNDWYFFTEASVSFLIRGKSNFYRSRYHFTKGRSRFKKRKSRAKF